MEEKIKIGLPVIVEGKYDKIRLSNIIDANIITTDGFGIFKNEEKKLLIRRVSKDGIIILCDSDRAGGFIRAALTGFLEKEKIYNLYAPCIEGVERRKTEKSKDGLLGIEGIDDGILRKIFLDFVEKHGPLGEKKSGEDVTNADFYELGLSGGENSKEKRNAVARKCGLPENMTTGALLSAINVLYTREEFLSHMNEIT